MLNCFKDLIELHDDLNTVWPYVYTWIILHVTDAYDHVIICYAKYTVL